jgi:hypothetical protein
LQEKEKFLFLVEVFNLTVCIEVSKTVSPKQRMDRPSSDTHQIIRYTHPPDSVLTGEFSTAKTFPVNEK